MFTKAVSNLTQGEFIRFVSLKEPQIAAILTRMSYKARLGLRRDIQVALARFAHGKPVLNATEGKFVHTNGFREVLDNSHAIQIRAMRVCQMIENNVRNAYLKTISSYIIMRYPEFCKNPQKVKSLAKQKWKKFLAKVSY